MGKLFFGDNLDVLARNVDDHSVDLIYLDPPFNSKAAYNVLYKSPVGADAQVRAFEDWWGWEKDGAAIALSTLSKKDITTFNMLRALQTFLGRSDLMAYLAMMAVRLVELKRVLKPSGSIYLHCDPTAGHYLKVLMDAVFGGQGFVNHITWKRSHAHSDGAQGARHYGRNSDALLFYSLSEERTWQTQFAAYDTGYLDRDYRRVDEHGRRYRLSDLSGPGGAAKGNPSYPVMGVTRHWRYSRTKMDELIALGKIIQTRPGAVPQLKRYLDEMPGVPLQEIWSDIPIINNRSKEHLGYPTQKPLALLQRIITTSSNPGDVVLDPFCGCGTAIHAAETLGRQWIGIDVTYLAIQVIVDRLKTWLPTAHFTVTGIPKDELSARKLAEQDPHVFQQWCVAKLGGQSRGKGGDGGVDGEIAFQLDSTKYGKIIVSVKGGKNLNPGMVRDLTRVVQREDADMGVLACLDPTDGMYREANSAGRTQLPWGHRPRIRIVKAAELVSDDFSLGIPTILNTITSAQAAKKISQRRPAKAKSPEELRREPPLPPMSLKGGKVTPAQPSLDTAEALLPVATKEPGRRKRG